MNIHWSTLLLQTVNALILIWLLARFLFRPVARIIAERQAQAERLLQDAEDERQAAQAEHQKAVQHLEDLAKHRSEAMSQATSESEELKNTVLKNAKKKAVQRRQEADHKLALETANLQGKLSEWVNQQASIMVEKLMTRLPDDARIGGFIAELADSLAALPSSDREELINNNEVYLIKCARALTTQESKELQSALDTALGHAIKIKLEVAPELIAGLEVDAQHFSIRNSLKADLEQLTQRVKLDHDLAI